MTTRERRVNALIVEALEAKGLRWISNDADRALRYLANKLLDELDATVAASNRAIKLAARGRKR